MYDLYSNSPNSFELRDCAVLRNRGSIMNNRYCCASKKRAIQRTSLAAIAMAFTMPVQAQEAQSEGLAEIIVTRSEEHTSELQSLMRISYAVFCLNKKKK